MKETLSVAVALATALLVSPVQAVDISAGESLYKKNCKACHGPTGKGLASYPKLAGRDAEYLADKLKRYRAGEKFGPNTPLMAPNAKKLSDDDITNIVEFMVTKFEK